MGVVRALLVVLILAPMLYSAEQRLGRRLGRLDHARTIVDLGGDLPHKVVTGIQNTRRALVSAIFEATRRSGSGRVTMTGTIKQDAGGDIVYLPTPKDRLLVWIGLDIHTFRVLEATGKADADTVTEWLGNTHKLRYRHENEEGLSIEVSDTTVGGRHSVRITGKVAHPDVRGIYDTDLSWVGTYYFESDRSGFELQTKYTVLGHLERKGIRLDVDESRKFHLIDTQVWQGATDSAPLGTPLGSTGAVSQSYARIGNKLRHGKNTYEWLDVEITKVLKGGRPSWPRRQWRVGGIVRENGEKWVEYKLDHSRNYNSRRRRLEGKLEVYVSTRRGEIILERYNWLFN